MMKGAACALFLPGNAIRGSRLGKLPLGGADMVATGENKLSSPG